MTDLAVGLSERHVAALSAVADGLEAVQRELDTVQARRVRLLAQAERLAVELAAGSPRSTRERDMARRTVASEIAVRLRLSDRSMQNQMSEALTLVEDYPVTLAAWETGRIREQHVRAVVDAGRMLPADARRRLDAAAVVACERLSTVQVKDELAHFAERLHPRTLTERHQDARRGRRVWVEVLGDGMSRLTADIPSVLAEAIRDRLTRQAAAFVDLRAQAVRRVRSEDGPTDAAADTADVALSEDTRTVEEIRTDILTDLLLTNTPDIDPTAHGDGHGELGAIRARVQVVIPATAVLGGNAPADLAGVGPMDAATARELAGNCPGLDRILVHPVTGQVLATDRYTPTLDLRRRLRARDRHCRFPGCRVPAIRCEHDHTVDHALGGPTRLENLCGLCQRHHSGKQFAPWKVRQLGDGRLEWTSPTGRVYIDEPPPPLVAFRPLGVVPRQVVEDAGDGRGLAGGGVGPVVIVEVQPGGECGAAG